MGRTRVFRPGGVRENAVFWAGNPKDMICDNHEENGSSGDGRRRALTVVGSFSRADRRYQHRFGAAIIYLF
jgi:hypothetical protein